MKSSLVQSSVTDIKTISDLEDELKKSLNYLQKKIREREEFLFSIQDKLNEQLTSLETFSEEEEANKTIKILENKVDNLIIKLNEAITCKKEFEKQLLVFNRQRVHYDKNLCNFDKKILEKKNEFKTIEDKFFSEQRINLELQQKIRDVEVKREEITRTRDNYIDNIIKKNEEKVEKSKNIQNQDNVHMEKSILVNKENTVTHKDNYSDYHNNYKLNSKIFEEIKEIIGTSDSNIISQ